MPLLIILGLYNGFAWIVSLTVLVLISTDHSRGAICAGSAVSVLFALATLFFCLVTVTSAMFVCRPTYPFGILSLSVLSLILIELPQFAMMVFFTVKGPNADVQCDSWNIGLTVLTGGPLLWMVILLCGFGIYSTTWGTMREEASTRVSIQPIQPEPLSVTYVG